MPTLPSLFISHGAPDLPIRKGSTQTFLQQLGNTLPIPRAILVISAHWLTAVPTVSTNKQPKTVYDFGGFPLELYQLNYPAPGDPALASRVVELFTAADWSVKTNATHGFDHGVWTPLILTYPNANIPVVSLSLQPSHGPKYHWQLGKLLAPLRSEGVLILGSGAATHNLRAFSDYGASPPHWAKEFDNWLTTTIHDNDIGSLLNYRKQAPYAVQNHPTEEHLLPLFVALGAGGLGEQIHQGFTYGAFSMSAFAFGD
ncbi:MAG: dioxygenase [Leptolyngbya sp. SIO3F4]|nr:dioxygenase [Leptolyngbya sp. SIO3F4]